MIDPRNWWPAPDPKERRCIHRCRAWVVERSYGDQSCLGLTTPAGSRQ